MRSRREKHCGSCGTGERKRSGLQRHKADGRQLRENCRKTAEQLRNLCSVSDPDLTFPKPAPPNPAPALVHPLAPVLPREVKPGDPPQGAVMAGQPKGRLHWCTRWLHVRHAMVEAAVAFLCGRAGMFRRCRIAGRWGNAHRLPYYQWQAVPFSAAPLSRACATREHANRT